MIACDGMQASKFLVRWASSSLVPANNIQRPPKWPAAYAFTKDRSGPCCKFSRFRTVSSNNACVWTQHPCESRLRSTSLKSGKRERCARETNEVEHPEEGRIIQCEDQLALLSLHFNDIRRQR